MIQLTPNINITTTLHRHLPPKMETSFEKPFFRLLHGEATLISRSRPLYALSVIFFFPVAFFLISFAATTSLSFFFPDQYSTAAAPFPQTLPALALVLLALLCSTASGFATISYAANETFDGVPLTLSAALKTLSLFFIPVFLTVIAGALNVLLFTMISVIPIAFAMKFLQIGHTPLSVSLICGGIAFVRLVCVIPRWGLAASVAVLESERGFSALNRSSDLVRWLRPESLTLLLYSVVSTLSTVFSPFSLITAGSHPWVYWILIIMAALASALCASTIGYYIVGNTLLYRYCKVLCGEAHPNTTLGCRAFRHCCVCGRLWLRGQTVTHCGITEHGGAGINHPHDHGCPAIQGLKFILEPV